MQKYFSESMGQYIMPTTKLGGWWLNSPEKVGIYQVITRVIILFSFSHVRERPTPLTNLTHLGNQ